MSEEKQPKERPGTTALPKPVALANTRNTVPSPQKKTPREPPKK